MLWVDYAIRKGDWLAGIARRYKTTLKELRAHNPQISDPDHVFVGTMIKVPIDNSISPADIGVPKDLPPPIVGLYVRAPDGVVIRFPSHIKLPYYGLAAVT